VCRKNRASGAAMESRAVEQEKVDPASLKLCRTQAGERRTKYKRFEKWEGCERK
jgi:hypothetical protein